MCQGESFHFWKLLEDYLVIFCNKKGEISMVDFLRRSWAVVDLDCINYNIRSIKQKLKPGCMIMGVVKADAYGHGDKYIADELVRLGVNWFAVSNLTEAMSLRNQGIYHPILILGTTPPNKAKQLCEYNITQAVFSLEYAKKLQQQAQRAGLRPLARFFSLQSRPPRCPRRVRQLSRPCGPAASSACARWRVSPARACP